MTGHSCHKPNNVCAMSYCKEKILGTSHILYLCPQIWLFKALWWLLIALKIKTANLKYTQKILYSLLPVSLYLQLYIVLFFSSVSSWFTPWPVFQRLKCTSFYLRAFTYMSQISFPLPVMPSPSPLPPSSTPLFSPNASFSFSQRWWIW